MIFYVIKIEIDSSIFCSRTQVYEVNSITIQKIVLQSAQESEVHHQHKHTATATLISTHPSIYRFVCIYVSMHMSYEDTTMSDLCSRLDPRLRINTMLYGR